jgi:hypothetical protein
MQSFEHPSICTLRICTRIERASKLSNYMSVQALRANPFKHYFSVEPSISAVPKILEYRKLSVLMLARRKGLASEEQNTEHELD